jgi:hypothetical protein
MTQFDLEIIFSSVEIFVNWNLRFEKVSIHFEEHKDFKKVEN